MAPVLRVVRASRIWAYRSLCLALVLKASIQIALGAEQLVDFDIPAQPLDQALNSFGEASGLQIFYETAPTTGHLSKSVRGRFDRETALQLLLQGSDLAGRLIAPGTISIVPLGKEADASLVEMKRAVVRYYGVMQEDIMAALCRDALTRPATYRVVLQYWIAPSGQIARVKLIGSSGDPERDDAVVRAIRSVTFDVPFQNVPQPVTLAIEPDGPDQLRDCDHGRTRTSSQAQ